MPAACSPEAPSAASFAAVRTRVLVVDDHEDIRMPLAAYLARQGLDVHTAADALQMRHLVRHAPFDLIVLDIMLPGEDGLSLCRHVVRELDTPVIFLTAMATARERIAGLETGADDYVVKPFDPAELMARIRTVLRRRGSPGAAARPPSSRFGFDGWVLDTARRQLTDPDGRAVALSDAEHQLLAALVAHPRAVLSRERLLDLTQRGAEAEVFDRSIDTQISRLRRKLEANPRRPGMIKTAWGNGYMFVADVRPLGS